MTEPFRIGKIGQVAFVVRELDARVHAFWNDFRIGPWNIYVFEPPRVQNMTYRGRRQDFRMRVAFAMCGETQIELVQSLQGPNVYEEFLSQCGEGVQHLGIHVTDMAAATGNRTACAVTGSTAPSAGLMRSALTAHAAAAISASASPRARPPPPSEA